MLDRAEGESENPVDALLALRVIDPACGSGHFLLAAARRIATRVARQRGGGVATAMDYRHALRDVARQCLYGVDRNPMAVELTKVALWIETIEPGKPLGFLDANIRCGDALLGVFDLEALRQGIPDEAYKPLTGDDKETARHFAARNRAEKAGQGALEFGGGGHGRLPPPPPLADASRALRALPEDSVEEIAEKQRRVRAAEADPRRWRWRVAADLYVAAFLTPKTGGVPANRNMVTIPTTGHVWAELSGQQVYGPLIGRAQDLAGEARAFHWPLEFPEAFAAGGFDVVLGNPPWEAVGPRPSRQFNLRWRTLCPALRGKDDPPVRSSLWRCELVDERPVNAPWPRPTMTQIGSPAFELTPWYWVPDREVNERLATKGWSRGWLMGWRGRHQCSKRADGDCGDVAEGGRKS